MSSFKFNCYSDIIYGIVVNSCSESKTSIYIVIRLFFYHGFYQHVYYLFEKNMQAIVIKNDLRWNFSQFNK